MNKDVTIITEGEFDAKVLNKLLKDKKFTNRYEILSASGYSSALSKVKSLMTFKNKKIILLLDTDTIEKNEIKQKEDFVNSYVNSGLNNDNFKTFWSIPEFEIIFLDNKKFLTELTPKKISKDLIELAKNSPRRTLENMSNKGREQYIALLEKKEVRDEFFKSGLIKEICDYMEK